MTWPKGINKHLHGRIRSQRVRRDQRVIRPALLSSAHLTLKPSPQWPVLGAPCSHSQSTDLDTGEAGHSKNNPATLKNKSLEESPLWLRAGRHHAATPAKPGSSRLWPSGRTHAHIGQPELSSQVQDFSKGPVCLGLPFTPYIQKAQYRTTLLCSAKTCSF